MDGEEYDDSSWTDEGRYRRAPARPDALLDELGSQESS